MADLALDPPATVDYSSYDDPVQGIVLRVEPDRGKYARRYLNIRIGEPGGVYDTLTDAKRVTLTRQQVVELTQQLTAWLGA